MAHLRILLGATIFAAVAPISTAWSQTDFGFYFGKTIVLTIGYAPGGGYDASGRIVARHMGKHIVGQPAFVTRNLPGAGSLIAANHLYNIAAKDGTEFGIIGSSVPFGPLWNRSGVKFDARKFRWIGSMERWKGIALFWADGPVTTIEEALLEGVAVGATSSGDVTSIYPRVLNALLGTHFKIIHGYQGTTDLALALEKGEVYGRFGWCWRCVKSEKPGWVAGSTVKVMMQLGILKDPELPSVPHLPDMLKSEEDRQIARLIFGSQEIARPFLAPPGVPNKNVETLRDAFQKTLSDPEFLSDAERLNMSIELTTAADVERLINEAYATPVSIIERAASIIGKD